ncbi:hypothetical protein [Alkalihalobacillus sp. R86527]|uniref:hypothetical protein n=1 Tax=Alkalihalobacillus sp. R86527 TaxID=3093863 RepID=UPI00366ABC64
MKRYVLIIVERAYTELAEEKLYELRREGALCELKVIERKDGEARIDDAITHRPLGSELLIYGAVDWSLMVERKAISEGFSRELIHMCTSLVENCSVFCSQCHAINGVLEERFVCENCCQKLEVSDHYSAYHRAYLAYPIFTIEKGEERDD